MPPIRKLLEQNRRLVLAIDGRCAAGKSTLADALAAEFGGAVVRMDHFFLPAARRVPDKPHIDTERFESEAALFIRRDEAFSYRVFDCRSQAFAGFAAVPRTRLLIVEGSYCLLPELEDLYGYRIFADISPELQKTRIIAREGADGYAAFRQRWIPAEERYFERCRTREKCDFVYV